MSRLLPAIAFACSLVLAGCGGDGDASSDAQEMAESHDGDTPTATEAAREPKVPVDAREVTYHETEEGNAATGYLAAPSAPDSVLSARGMDPAATSLPGLVVIHEWWGLNDNIRTATRRLAGEGYRALAVDLYGDSTAQTPDQAQSLMQQATQNTDRLLANVHGAHEHLQSEGEAPRVAVMGWCFGGSMTFRALADRPTTFDAAVAYYGNPEPMTNAVLEELTTPTMAHFGRQDEMITTKQVEVFRERLEDRGPEGHVYEYDAGHAFANPSGENYDAEAASTAWSRTTDFLRTHLYSTSSGM